MDKKSIINLSIKLAWLGLSLSIGITQFLNGQYSEKYALGFVLMMSLITFPIGYIVAFGMNFLFWAAHHLFGLELPSSLICSVFLWIAYTVAGYFQWFYFVPMIFRKIKAPAHHQRSVKREDRAPSNVEQQF